MYSYITTHTNACSMTKFTQSRCTMRIELPAKLLDYFLWRNKSNINPCASTSEYFFGGWCRKFMLPAALQGYSLRFGDVWSSSSVVKPKRRSTLDFASVGLPRPTTSTSLRRDIACHTGISQSNHNLFHTRESCHIHGLHYRIRVSLTQNFLLSLFFRYGISFKPCFIESSYRWISHWHVTYKWVTSHEYMCVCAYVAIYIHVRTMTLSHMHTPNRGAHTNSSNPHYVVYRDCVRVCVCGYINLYSTCK